MANSFMFQLKTTRLNLKDLTKTSLLKMFMECTKQLEMSQKIIQSKPSGLPSSPSAPTRALAAMPMS